MTASLIVDFNDPQSLYATDNTVIRQSLQQAFAAWMSHFDVTTGTLTLTVSFAALHGTPNAGIGVSATSVGTENGSSVDMSSAALTLTAGATGGRATATYAINPADAGTDAITQIRTFEVAFGRILGVFTETAGLHNTVQYGSTYDRYRSINSPFFLGPNTQVIGYARPFAGPTVTTLPLNSDDTAAPLPLVADARSVFSAQDPATTIQPLDVAILKDTGLAILTDQEIQEHQLTRLYQALFNRTPDLTGLIGWTDKLQQGATLHDVANGFLASDEFTQHIGAAPTALVDTLHIQALHHAADATGEAYWTAALAGGLSRADLVIAFSESSENRLALSATANTAYAVTVEQEVARLYDTAFRTTADPSGFQTWTTALINTATIGQVAAAFLQSPAFATQNGAALSDDAFVTTLYRNALGRTPDASGKAYWLATLAAGTTRPVLLASFSDTAEHIQREAALAITGTGPGTPYTPTPLGLLPTHANGSQLG